MVLSSFSGLFKVQSDLTPTELEYVDILVTSSFQQASKK